MEYIIGQSYDMKVSQVVVENFPTSIFYVLADNNQKIRAYDFEKKRCSKVESIKCIFKGLDEFGKKVFQRDRLFLLKDLYEPGHIYDFKYRFSKKEKDGFVYYYFKDIFGMQQVFRGPLKEGQRKKDTKVSLYLRAIDEQNINLILDRVPAYSETTSIHIEGTNDLDVLFNNYIKSGEDSVLRSISKSIMADLRVEMWGSLYRMSQKLGAKQQTLKEIRSEIVSAYKNVSSESIAENNELNDLSGSAQRVTKVQRQLGKLFEEGKSISEIMGTCSLTRYETVKNLIQAGYFYLS